MSNSDIEFLKELNIAYGNQPRDVIEENIDLVIRTTLNARTNILNDSLSNSFSVISNYIRIIVRDKYVNPNFALSSVLKNANNYIGLFFLGMLIRNGANPNVYYPVKGYGNLHILALLSIRNRDNYDPYFGTIANTLRLLGSDINYPAIDYGDSSGDIDVNFVKEVVDEGYGSYKKTKLTVKEFIREQGKYIDEDLNKFFNAIGYDQLLPILISADKPELMKNVFSTTFFFYVLHDIVNIFCVTQRMLNHMC